MKKSVKVITDPATVRLLVDPMRREMIRLLSNTPMTENELAEALGLSDPAVGHHLKILKDAGLINVVKKEAEEHGIVQKFYGTSALAYFIDSREMPLEIERYFMPVNLERARGIVAALGVLSRRAEYVAAKDLEEFARILAFAIVEVASQYVGQEERDREETVGRVYRAALSRLQSKPWFLPETVRDLLLRAGKTNRLKERL